jgi:putative heme iron utilization protein
MTPTDKPDSEQQAWAARQLWAGRFAGVLSTHSLDLPGYPFGSVVPYCLDASGSPVFLLSHLSQHTKNLDANPRCSLTVFEAGDSDVQQSMRIVAVGDIEPLSPELGVRYPRYFPQSEFYLRELNFRFYRLLARRFHVNAGFATARWFGPDRILRTNPLQPSEESGLLEHMNQDHPEALRSYLRQTGVFLDAEDIAAVRLAGMDGEGIDLRVGDDSNGRIHRIALPQRIENRDEAREVLIEMARGT